MDKEDWKRKEEMKKRRRRGRDYHKVRAPCE
jgi:hypothetical protein